MNCKCLIHKSTNKFWKRRKLSRKEKLIADKAMKELFLKCYPNPSTHSQT